MKKSRGILVILAVCVSIMSQHSIAFANEGGTSLEILPLDEKYPRIYEVNDLDFGKYNLHDNVENFHPKNDLTIKILDSRINSTSWELQVKLSNLVNLAHTSLPSASISIGEGNVKSEIGNQLVPYSVKQNLDESTYQTILKSTSDSSHGWISYRIKKEDIRLSFSKASEIGEYQTINNWRFINAKF
jgi:hypothetical protein